MNKKDRVSYNQARQEKFLMTMSEKEINDDVGVLRDYSFTCRDCEVSRMVHTADTCLMLLREHEGHDTWIKYLGKR